MDSHRQDLRRGFNWLGGAMVIAKVTDFGTILIVLMFLTKREVGLAALVVAIGTVIEALDGLGTGAALVQAPSLSRLQLSSIFWYIAGAAVIAGAITLLAAPGFAALYGLAGLAPYFLPIALKQPLVGAAVIPLALMSRELQYERIAVVNVCSTLGSAATRVALAALGAGAWAIVIASAASGLYTLIGASFARPFRPALRFSIPAISPLVRFGLRAAMSTLFEQSFNNVDYLLVGWFYGPAPLAIYRVAFEIGMQPALAAGTLVNRAALPVFARVSAVREHLEQSLTWSLRRLTLVVAPLTAATLLAAVPITALIHDGEGHSYAAAALPLELLSAAALLRVLSQLLYPLALGTGHPKTALRLSAATLLLLGLGMLGAGIGFRAPSGIVAIATVWLAVYPLLLLWEIRYLRRRWDIRAAELARTLAPPLAGTIALVAVVEIARLVLGSRLEGADVGWQVAVVATAAVLTYAGLFLVYRQRAGRVDGGIGARH
ncbi:MAG TPA: oligosaccharide flippase family protein [Steroidobacteraceae bacterium]|nr:oligosaccharide flippase family protein [Steroidobacteraceae bacterium]